MRKYAILLDIFDKMSYNVPYIIKTLFFNVMLFYTYTKRVKK